MAKLKAIKLTNVDFSTGTRPGDINPKAPWNRCHPHWQDLERGVEVRIIIDDEITETGIPSNPDIEFLEGETAIQKAIDDIQASKESQYKLEHEHLAVEYIRQNGVDITDCKGLSGKDLVKKLHSKGVAGVKEKKAKKTKLKDIRFQELKDKYKKEFKKER